MIVPWWRSHGSRSNLQQAAALAWHSVGDDDPVFDGLLSTPLPGGSSVACVVCICLCGGVRFGVLCTNVSFSYMTEQCSSYLLKERLLRPHEHIYACVGCLCVVSITAGPVRNMTRW